MSADKLGRYITSPAFLARANEAVSRAVARLEAKGIKPAYVERGGSGMVSEKADQTSQAAKNSG